MAPTIAVVRSSSFPKSRSGTGSGDACESARPVGRALASAVAETERRVGALREELDGLRRSRDAVFRASPIDWIEERLTKLRPLLEQATERSAQPLRQILGTIRLEPTREDIGCPYYLARTSIDTLAQLDPAPGSGGSEPGSNSLRWWTRTQRIRTVSTMALEAEVRQGELPPAYQRIAARAIVLHQLGLGDSAIGRHLGVSDKTIRKALMWGPGPAGPVRTQPAPGGSHQHSDLTPTCLTGVDTHRSRPGQDRRGPGNRTEGS